MSRICMTSPRSIFVHHLDAALRARELYLKESNYLIDQGEVEDRLIHRASSRRSTLLRRPSSGDPKRASKSKKSTRRWPRYLAELLPMNCG